MQLAALILTFIFTTKAFAVECPMTDAKTFKQALKGKGEIEVIFFASWCVSCRPHLEKKTGPNTVYVAIYDEKQRAEKVLKSFAKETICFTSDGIAEDFGVRSLPASRKMPF